MLISERDIRKKEKSILKGNAGLLLAAEAMKPKQKTKDDLNHELELAKMKEARKDKRRAGRKEFIGKVGKGFKNTGKWLMSDEPVFQTADGVKLSPDEKKMIRNAYFANNEVSVAMRYVEPKLKPSQYGIAKDYMNSLFEKGGHVSKGELVWKKLTSSEKIQFLSENFTPEITPRSQEILVGKTYNFLPKNVKIKIESKYSNIEEYADGVEVETAVEELWKGYASAILFSEIDSDTEESLDANYSIDNFDEETVKSSKELLKKFYSENLYYINKSGLELFSIGSDIWYARAGHGVGFFDRELDSTTEKELTDGAKRLGEYPSVETYDGKISVRGGRVMLEDGGEVEGVNLFEDYENIPSDVQVILDKYSKAFEDGDYKGLAKAHKELEKIGYTFEYYLDGQAYDLRKIGQKGKVELEIEEQESEPSEEEFGQGDVIEDLAIINLEGEDKNEKEIEYRGLKVPMNWALKNDTDLLNYLVVRGKIEKKDYFSLLKSGNYEIERMEMGGEIKDSCAFSTLFHFPVK